MSNVASIVGAGSTVESVSATSGDDLGKEEFLRLLITQLQLQDPFEAMDSKEMIAQLAQFSSLEQMENMNVSLNRTLEMDLLLGQLINNTMSTNLIGKGIRSQTNAFTQAGGTDTTLGYTLHGNATDVTVTIYDSLGNEVATLDGLEGTKGNHTFTWDGKNNAGTSVGGGDFTFEISAMIGDETVIQSDEYFVGVVDGIRYVDGNAYVVVGETELIMSAIDEVMESL